MKQYDTRRRHYHLFCIIVTLIFSLIVDVVVSSTKHNPFHVTGSDDPSQIQVELLTTNVLEILDRGQTYKHQSIDGYSGTGIVIQDIHASPATVWKILLDFDQYSQRIPKVASCQPYTSETGAGTTTTTTTATTSATTSATASSIASKTAVLTENHYIYQRLTLGFRWLSLQAFVRHESHPNVLLWTLDESKTSDLEESTGYWYIEAHPTREGWSRVTYHVHVTLMEWVPSFVWKFMTKQALGEATSWVKKYSEAEERRHINDEVHCDAYDTSCPNVGMFVEHTSPMGISTGRYFLVTSVWGLLFFNTYLYFSHYR